MPPVTRAVVPLRDHRELLLLLSGFAIVGCFCELVAKMKKYLFALLKRRRMWLGKSAGGVV